MMSEIKFSLILASRERIPLLKGLLDSIQATTKDKNCVEILVAFDIDDIGSVSVMQNLTEMYRDINLHCFMRERSEWMHRDYINWMFPSSKGKYIIILNDDTLFINQDWDELAFAKIEDYLTDKPDGMVYGYTDNSGYVTPGHHQFSCFPLISRKAVEALGFVMPNERKTWGGDSDLCGIFRHPDVNRTLDVSEIKIKHVSYHTGLRDRDEVSHNIERIFRGNCVNVPVDHYAEIVRDKIARG
jgi:hypothetical protein